MLDVYENRLIININIKMLNVIILLYIVIVLRFSLI